MNTIIKDKIDKSFSVKNFIEKFKKYIAYNVFFLTLFLHIPYFYPSVSLGPDEAMYILVADQFHKGNALYSEIYMGKPPGTPYFLFLQIELFGFNLTAFRAVISIINSFSVVLVFLIAKKLYNYNVGCFAAILMALHISVPTFGAFRAPTDSYMLFFSLLSFFIIVNENKVKPYANYFFGGLCIGLSLLFKQSALLIMPALFYAIFMLNKSKELSTLSKHTTFFVFGFLTPILAVLFNFYLINDLDIFLEMVIFDRANDRTAQGSSFFSLPFFKFSNVANILSIFIRFPVVFLFGSAFLISDFFYRYTKFKALQKNNILQIWQDLELETHRLLLIILWILGTIFFILKVDGPRDAYFLYLLPPMSILAGCFFDKFINLAADMKEKGLMTYQIFTNSFSFMIILLLLLSLIPYPYPADFMGKISIYNENRVIDEVSVYISETTSDDEKIFVLAYTPQIYLTSNREPASPNHYMIINSDSSKNRLLVDDLIRNKPIYVITVENNSYTQTLNGTGSWLVEIPDVIDYIKDNYSIHKVFLDKPYTWPEGDFYIWKINSDNGEN